MTTGTMLTNGTRQGGASASLEKQAGPSREQHGIKGVHAVFSAESFEKLTGIMYKKKAETGSVLYWEGDKADKLYFLMKGRVKITKSSDDGRTFTLSLHQAGDLFGQLDPFQDSAHASSAEMTEDGEVGVIQRKDLEVLLWQHGDLAIEFMRWMGLTHRITQTKMRDLMMFGKPGALCSLLIRLSNSCGVDLSGGRIRLDIRMNNSEMADMIGATRESVNRMLNDMKKEGVIQMDGGIITILKLDYLRGVCQCESCPKEICRM
ncbi:CRP/FNR family transcriptional regulator, anaerobic regulatory protein [Paenibacillus sp. UNCCL117]|uniref:Crp/Fnr family transcriptional regulator n=1 Tax=unclassified Paenibacillus TaxID=185978 RepID=UPI00088DE71A|nr:MULTISPECIES: Crp/Fnr family transcriptional regulator [unclassified Paenibacillus]SDD13792.1 CRP/FNR family transcriptional regulator, anaerobic regulatory protein [Paenibacillus sp. cl123]SFW34064.1 CRP/FNR family transcriptional regulator, anaerobic regulatory protein [Paenibacillus sp. UNCCL117]